MWCRTWHAALGTPALVYPTLVAVKSLGRAVASCSAVLLRGFIGFQFRV